MTKRKVFPTLVVFACAAMISTLAWAARVGEAAPEFVATDSNGQTHRLSDYRGKFVVLEWTNRGCPYTRKHYDSGNMQRLQQEWNSKGIIWLTVLSSAPGKQGYMDAAQENAYLKQMNAHPTAALLDPTGALGHLYDAKTTPDMYVINPQGMLVYDGAIDDRPTMEPCRHPGREKLSERGAGGSDERQAGERSGDAALWMLGEIRELSKSTIRRPEGGADLIWRRFFSFERVSVQ